VIQIARNGDLSLRFYTSDFCVLAKHNGARRLIEGPIATILLNLNNEIGVRGIRHLINEDIVLKDIEQSDDAIVVRDEIRQLFKGLNQAEMGGVDTLLHNSTGDFHKYCIQHRVPLIGMCEITYRCNLRCQHCYVLHKIQENQPAHGDTQAVLRLIESMAELGCLDLTLTGGESTLHKGYWTFVKAAKAFHLYTTLKTNGTTFTRNVAEKYAEDPAHETDLSLYGANATLHDTFTSVPGSFEKTISGMQELARVGIRCNVNCVVWEGNSNNLNDIERIVNDLGHHISFSDVIYGRLNGDRFPLSLRIRPETRARLISEGRLKPFKVSPCIAGQMKVKVDAEGNVSTCELLPQGFGNAFVTPLQEVWRSQEVENFSDSVVGISMSERNGGSVVHSCPGLNLLNTGELFGRTTI